MSENPMSDRPVSDHSVSDHPVSDTTNGSINAQAGGSNGRNGSNGVAAPALFGNVRQADIVAEMQGAYLDYAMSVIVSRALPDVRDGLKPVHRRILYAMSHDLGLDHTKPHKKSARIVGEVLGKYHPHGDSAVYDAMVRMAQRFSLRYPLVDGQGNFGSVDGDNAAAMRYTEARLAEISQLMMADLEKDTVEWNENFDNSLREPDILPAALPNLLINGSSGIAVGMATNVPPHNLSEIVDALAFMLDRYDRVDDITVEHLMQFVKGPDFPTGGILYRYRDDRSEENIDVVAQGYAVGRAHLVVQAKAHFEEMSRGRSRIVITELPYQANKVALLERIAALVRDGKLEGIADLRDESDRTGMRVVIELTRAAVPKDVLADLFKQTPLQQTFGMQMLALVDGEPRTLSLKRMLQLFIEHRREIIRRRSEFDLNRARERAHILEGLLRALDILDEVISTIRRSQSSDTARTNLMRNFGFTQVQAQAILDMQLRRLAALERRKLQEEYNELQKRIAYLEDLLANPMKILSTIKEDLLEIKEKYGDVRRTQIVDRTKGTLTSTDLLPDQPVWVALGANGELRRQEMGQLSAATLRQIGHNSEIALLATNTRDFLYLFAGDGRCRRVAIHDIPQNGEAKHLAELTDFTRRDEIAAALALPRTLAPETPGHLFLATGQGMVKRITLGDFAAAAATDPTVLNVEAKDRLRFVVMTQGDQDVILVSAQGQSIRFREDDVRTMGLAAGGVGGMKLKKGDAVIYAAAVDPLGDLLTITDQGFAKRTPLEQYSTQGRNGGGIVTHKISSRTGPVAAALLLPAEAPPEHVVVLFSRGRGQVVAVEEVPPMGRSVQGKLVVELKGTARVTALQTVVAPPDFAPAPPPADILELPSEDDEADDEAGQASDETPIKAADRAAGEMIDGARVDGRQDVQAKAPKKAPKRSPVKDAPAGKRPVAKPPAENAEAEQIAEKPPSRKRMSSPAAPKSKPPASRKSAPAKAKGEAKGEAKVEAKAETVPKPAPVSKRAPAPPEDAAARARGAKKESRTSGKPAPPGGAKAESPPASRKSAPAKAKGGAKAKAKAEAVPKPAPVSKRAAAPPEDAAARARGAKKEGGTSGKPAPPGGAKAESPPASRKSAPAQTSSQQAVQPSLLDDVAAPAPAPKARKARKLATVTTVRPPKAKKK